jgi:hypothetical protein
LIEVCRYPLNRELDDGATNLSSTPLPSLHAHITTDLDAISREEVGHHKCLSQESLKDAANLLAVQDSELLRHTALSLLLLLPTSRGGGDGDASEPLPLLTILPGVLQSLRGEVSGSRARLEWNCDFHRNHLLRRYRRFHCVAA